MNLDLDPEHQPQRPSEDRHRLYALLRQMYAIAGWAHACVPETLSDTFGDVTPYLSEVEQLLKQHDDEVTHELAARQ